MPNSEIIKDYHTYLTAGGKAAGTISVRLSHVRRLLQFVGKPAVDVERGDVIEWLAANNWGAAARRSAIVSTRQFFTWLQQAGYSATNVAADLPAVVVPRGVPAPCPDAYIADAMSASDKRVRLAVELMATCGLRRAECAKVRADDVRPTGTGWSLLVEGKGGVQRYVPMRPALARRISQSGGWLFPGNDHGHISAGYLGKLVSRALPAGWSAHKLRHRYATVAYSHDRDLRAVQELLGHASAATTQIYTLVDDSRRVEVAAAAWAIAA